MIFIWIILFVLTTLSLFVGYATFVGFNFIAVLFFITFVKGQLVADYFMGLKNVSLKFRLIPTVWLLFVVLLICIAYLLPVKT